MAGEEDRLGGDDPNKTDNASGQDKGSDKTETEKPPANSGQGKVYSKKEVEEIVEDRLKRDRKKQAENEERIKAETEARTLRESGEYKVLAEKLQREAETLKGRIKELEPFETEVQALSGVLKGEIESKRKGLPKFICDLLDSKPPAEQLEWLTANAASVAKTIKGKGGQEAEGNGEADQADEPNGEVNGDDFADAAAIRRKADAARREAANLEQKARDAELGRRGSPARNRPGGSDSRDKGKGKPDEEDMEVAPIVRF